MRKPARARAVVVLGLLATLAALPAAGAEAAGSDAAGTAPGGTFLRFLRARGTDAVLTRPPRLHVSFGGPRIPAVMDTGSTGLVVAADMIPGWEALPSPGPARLTYSSSGRVMEGRWVVTQATISGRDGAAVRTQPLPVMAVTRITCLPGARQCTPEDRPRHVAMLGIGFARQGDHQAQSTPDRNPFLRLEGMGAGPPSPGPMQQGRMRPGYVVTHRGVEAGLGPPQQYASFLTVRLARSPDHADWAAAPVCISVAGRLPPACGTVLVDTGVSRMFLTVPKDQLGGALDGLALAPGTPVALELGKPGEAAIGYTVRAGDNSDPRAPQGITLVRPGERPTFVNTSLHALNGFDYMYDADQGLVGFRSRR